MPEWTKEQKAAIEDGGKNILVAAAAGSGKTAVLVERIIQKVLRGDCDVDALLVVTFTDAAAREMRERVEAALEEQLAAAEKASERARIERQLVLLSGASISTLHSFCANLLRRHFDAIDLDPQFRIGGAQELTLLRQETMEQLFAEEYERGDKGFLNFVDDYGTDHGDEELFALIEKLYDFSRAQAFPEKWLEEKLHAFDIPGEASIRDTLWFPVLKKSIRFSLDEIREQNQTAAELTAGTELEAYAEVFATEQEDLEKLSAVLETGTWEEIRTAFLSFSWPRLPRVKDADSDVKKQVQDLRKRYKDTLKKVQDQFFQQTEAELLTGVSMAYPDLLELGMLTTAFSHAFDRAKKERTMVDFSDLEHLAIRILVEGGGPDAQGRISPSATALALREKYQEVMVDEYQDTNEVQETIVQMVSRHAPDAVPNLFVVGDVKQSIYRFRLADPTLFLKKFQDYPRQPETCERIDLRANFRSRPEVLSAVNDLFSQLMVPESMEIDYDEAAALHWLSDYPDSADGKTLKGPQELAILIGEGEEAAGAGTPSEAAKVDAAPADEAAEERQELTRLELEAQYIAQRIRQFMEEGTMVFDKHARGYRPLEYRDIVILMRSVKDKAEKMLEILQANGIPTYAASNTGYFEASEVRLMLSLLSVIDNARQDIPLAAVLLSPIGGFTLSEMASVRLAAEGDIFSALLTSANPEKHLDPEVQRKAADFLARLSRWRRIAAELSVPELIWRLYRDTGYYDYVGGLPGGLLKQANLRLLASRAADYEKSSYRGLFRFLRFVEHMQKSESDLSVARTLGESENVVRIMTIHHSKGLEFPLVFLANLEGGFNLQDLRDQLLIHRDLGFGPYASDTAGGYRYRFETLPLHAVRDAIEKESKAEELRLLYVALTRAREKFVLVGFVRDEATLEKKAQVWCTYAARTERRLPPHAPLSAKNDLDWVGMALVHHPDGKALRDRGGAAAQVPAFLDDGEDNSCRWQISLVPIGKLSLPENEETTADEILSAVRDGLPLPATPKKEAVEALLSWHYPEHGLAEVPAKVSVSELKRRFAAQEEETPSVLLTPPPQAWSRPRFIQEEKKSTGTEYGTLMHSVLQYADFRGDCSLQGLKAQLQRMVAEEKLTEDMAGRVNIPAVAAFYRSMIGERMKRARQVMRELPFTRLLEAKRFYPAADAGEKVLIQGIIDLLFEDEAGKWILVDYKTDKDTDPQKITKRYALQIRLYAEAVETMLGKPVAERYLYLLHDGKILSLGKADA